MRSPPVKSRESLAVVLVLAPFARTRRLAGFVPRHSPCTAALPFYTTPYFALTASKAFSLVVEHRLPLLLLVLLSGFTSR